MRPSTDICMSKKIHSPTRISDSAKLPAVSRRNFLRATGNIALGLGVVGPNIFLNRTKAATGQNPSEFIRVGFIGVANQGNVNLGGLMKNAVAVCDVDQTHLKTAQAR